jgi:hypothetical protein
LKLPRLVQFSRNQMAGRVATEPPDEWPVNTIRFSSATALDTCNRRNRNHPFIIQLEMLFE